MVDISKQTVKEYVITVIIINLLSVIVTLVPALIGFSPDKSIFSKIDENVFVVIPTGFIIIGAISQYYIHSIKDLLICIAINLATTIIIILPFLLSFANEILLCLALYWIVFFIGLISALIVRLATEFINTTKNK